jgi:CheY-like chemotaxis protein
VPIHVISGAEQAASVIDMGAFGITEKPASHEELAQVFATLHKHITRPERRLLVLGDARARKAVASAVKDPHVSVDTAASVAKAGNKLVSADVLLLAYADSEQTLSELENLNGVRNSLPIILLSQNGQESTLSAAVSEQGGMRDIMVVSAVDELPPRLAYATRRGRRPATASDTVAATALQNVPELAGAKILIVDDDIRNIYSLTSVLESYDVEVLHAERGRDGILILEQTPGVDIGLIDIMMPEMDGYETMQQIRARPELADLPLIAVTAKAMKGDRQKCLDAGASDYIAKPVDIELLLALLRVWISRARERPVGLALESAAAE